MAKITPTDAAWRLAKRLHQHLDRDTKDMDRLRWVAQAIFPLLKRYDYAEMCPIIDWAFQHTAFWPGQVGKWKNAGKGLESNFDTIRDQYAAHLISEQNAKKKQAREGQARAKQTRPYDPDIDDPNSMVGRLLAQL